MSDTSKTPIYTERVSGGYVLSIFDYGTYHSAEIRKGGALISACRALGVSNARDIGYKIIANFRAKETTPDTCPECGTPVDPTDPFIPFMAHPNTCVNCGLIMEAK